ncbi:ATP-binding cassette domain-containing protein [Streptomyces tendae]|uniref:ATP-binding cassette domain-containing protein n=1 Tax=Streptomyces tendae TaxID=1932 RepID=UPI0033DB216D
MTRCPADRCPGDDRRVPPPRPHRGRPPRTRSDETQWSRAAHRAQRSARGRPPGRGRLRAAGGPGNPSGTARHQFHPPRGRVVGLLGPSGCGKTTLLRCVVGVQQPSVGHVQVLGHTAGAWPLRTRVGYADRCDRLLLMRAGRLLAGADRGSLLNTPAATRWRRRSCTSSRPPGAVGVRETGSPLRTRGTPADPLENTHLPVGDGICSRSWARGRSNVGRPGQPSAGVSRKEGVGTAVDPASPAR